MFAEKLDSDLLRYIVAHGFRPGARLPSLEELSAELKSSIGKLREQLEVARSLGIVEVRPRTGIRLTEYSFLPAVRFSLLYALAGDPSQFQAFGALRNHLEASFWHEAVALLTADDHAHLRELVRLAWVKLDGQPIQIPHAEHRELHLTIFRRLDNPFVKGLLEAYWEAYEAVGLSLYSDYHYLREVWTYHEGIVNALTAGDVDQGYRLLVEHTTLLRYRETPQPAAVGGEAIPAR
ncbi:MAG: FadR family transcriptional regulator [Chloroflexi bacterium]|nr:FadR family transcriptional regulator [Chloroflexota bacterium]